MKRAVKKKKSAQILPWLLMMAAAVALGLYMPGFFTRIQNNRTDNTREMVDLGSSMLSITSDRPAGGGGLPEQAGKAGPVLPVL